MSKEGHDVKCVFCLEESVEDCRRLGCGHRSCFSCIENQTTLSRDVQCPKCRETFTLVNVDLLEKVSKDKDQHEEILSAVCENCQEPAAVFCVFCQLLLCKEHMQEDQIAAKRARTPHHYQVPVEDFQSDREFYLKHFCRQHAGVETSKACTKCLQIFCDVCNTTQECQYGSHNFCHITDVSKSTRNMIGELQKLLAEKKAEILGFEKDIIAGIEHVTDEKMRMMDDVERFVKEQVHIITQKGQQVKDEIEKFAKKFTTLHETEFQRAKCAEEQTNLYVSKLTELKSMVSPGRLLEKFAAIKEGINQLLTENLLQVHVPTAHLVKNEGHGFILSLNVVGISEKQTPCLALSNTTLCEDTTVTSLLGASPVIGVMQDFPSATVASAAVTADAGLAGNGTTKPGAKISGSTTQDVRKPSHYSAHTAFAPGASACVTSTSAATVDVPTRAGPAPKFTTTPGLPQRPAAAQGRSVRATTSSGSLVRARTTPGRFASATMAPDMPMCGTSKQRTSGLATTVQGGSIGTPGMAAGVNATLDTAAVTADTKCATTDITTASASFTAQLVSAAAVKTPLNMQYKSSARTGFDRYFTVKWMADDLMVTSSFSGIEVWDSHLNFVRSIKLYGCMDVIPYKDKLLVLQEYNGANNIVAYSRSLDELNYIVNVSPKSDFPSQIATAKDMIFASDPTNKCVYAYTVNGEKIHTLALTDAAVTAGLCITRDGSLLISSLRSKVRKYQIGGDYSLTWESEVLRDLYGITEDSNGLVYGSKSSQLAIYVLASDGVRLKDITCDELRNLTDWVWSISVSNDFLAAACGERGIKLFQLKYIK